MRVVVTGATGNVGTSVLEALGGEPQVSEIVGLARRVPEIELPKVEWVGADITEDELVPVFAGADAVVHLAWAIQPSRDESVTERINVEGSRRVSDGAGVVAERGDERQPLPRAAAAAHFEEAAATLSEEEIGESIVCGARSGEARRSDPRVRRRRLRPRLRPPGGPRPGRLLRLLRGRGPTQIEVGNFPLN